jgi:hypothetical protein
MLSCHAAEILKKLVYLVVPYARFNETKLLKTAAQVSILASFG